MRTLACVRDVLVSYPIPLTNGRGATFLLNPNAVASSHDLYTEPEDVLSVAIPLMKATQALQETHGGKVSVDVQLETRLKKEGSLSEVIDYHFDVGISRKAGASPEDLETAVLSFLKSVPLTPHCGGAPEGLFEKIRSYKPVA